MLAGEKLLLLPPPPSEESCVFLCDVHANQPLTCPSINIEPVYMRWFKRSCLPGKQQLFCYFLKKYKIREAKIGH